MYGSATSETAIADWTRVCDAELLERVLQRERVQQRREHARVVGGGTIHSVGGRRHAAVEVPAADHDRELGAAAPNLDDLAGDRRHRLRVDTVLTVAHQALTRELQQHAAERRGSAGGRRPHRVVGLAGSRAGDRDPLEALQRRSGLGERCPDRLRLVVDPCLVDEDAAG